MFATYTHAYNHGRSSVSLRGSVDVSARRFVATREVDHLRRTDRFESGLVDAASAAHATECNGSLLLLLLDC